LLSSFHHSWRMKVSPPLHSSFSISIQFCILSLTNSPHIISVEPILHASRRRQPCCARAGQPTSPRLRPAVAWRRRATARCRWPARPGPRPSLSLRTSSSSMTAMATFVKLEKTKVEDALIYSFAIDH
jgi:hypothetical protein